MGKLHLVLENVRDRHMINILEEGTTELVALKTKQFLNENLSIINKILVEEGVVEGAKSHLANNWGKYAAGAAGAGAGIAADQAGAFDGVQAAYQQAAGGQPAVENVILPDVAAIPGGVIPGVQAGAEKLVDNVGNIAGQVQQGAGNIVDQAGQYLAPTQQVPGQ